MAALSNGSFAAITSLAKHGELTFDCIISAELATSYKADRSVYLRAAELLEVRPDHVLMTAAHQWDFDGAHSAGMRTAFVNRPAEYGSQKTIKPARSTGHD